MEFIVNQKLVSLTGKYFIKDKSGNDVFVVKGSFSLPRKFRVFDMQGKEIVCVKKRMFRLLERFDFYEGKERICYAKQKFSVKPKYDFYGTDLKIEGSLLAHNCYINRDGKTVARIYKSVTLIRDSYIVSVEDEENVPFVIAVAVMLDHVHHRGNYGILTD